MFTSMVKCKTAVTQLLTHWGYCILLLCHRYTVYPKKYAHGFVVLCFVTVMQSFIMNSHEVFIHIHQGCFAGTGAIVRLPQCQWSKPDGYGKISQCITTTKHSKAKIVCIFLGIYCKVSHYATLYPEKYINLHCKMVTSWHGNAVRISCHFSEKSLVTNGESFVVLIFPSPLTWTAHWKRIGCRNGKYILKRLYRLVCRDSVNQHCSKITFRLYCNVITVSVWQRMNNMLSFRICQRTSTIYFVLLKSVTRLWPRAYCQIYHWDT